MATTIGGISTTATTPLTGAELLEAEQGGVSVKLTAQDIADLASIAVEDAVGAVGDAKTLKIIGATVEEISPGVIRITVPAPGGALAVEDEGSEVDAAVVRINFTGAAVTVTPTAPGEVDVAISASSGPQPYDMGLYLSGLQPDNTQVLKYVFPRAVDFLGNFAGCEFHAGAAATSEAVYTIKKNGTNVGTITVAASGTTGTWASSGGAAVSFADGDRLELITPTPQDATLASASITFAGSRT